MRWYCGAIPKNIFEEHEKLLNKYEGISKRTCIMCGKQGKIDYKESYLLPMCDKCRKEK